MMESAISLLEQLANHSNDLTFVYDFDKQQFQFLSDSAHQLLGLDKEAINQQPAKLLSLIPAEDKEHVLEEIGKLKRGSHHINFTFRIMLDGQQIKWLHLKAYRLAQQNNQNTFFAGIAEDITTQKIYEQGVLAIKEQKNVILQVLGHDLRTPLSNISLSMNLLTQELNVEENKKVKNLIDIVERTCRNSLAMIKQIINLEYVETQEMGIQKRRDDIIFRIQNQIDTFRSLDRSGKTFLFHKNTESLYTSIDSIRFMLIIENLLTNAYKFTKPEGVIEVYLEAQEQSVLIKVQDNGIGIPENLKPLIFDKFTSARRKGTQGEVPVGLGMHLIKTMVEQLEGRIWFESQEGQGTTFYVELPL